MDPPEPLTGIPFIPREKDRCKDCGPTAGGTLIARNGQNCVYCAKCFGYLYNAPKTETGEVPRTVATLRPGLKPSQQARVLQRDAGRCRMCHRDDRPLHIGHCLSMKEGLALGVPMDLLESDDNKITLCEACDLGLGAHSISAPFYVSIVGALIQAPTVRTP